MSSYRRKLLFIFLLFNVCLLAASLIYGHITKVAIDEGREAVECVFKRNMNLYCPGCGGSRSLVALLELDIIKSFIYYPALPLALVLIIDIDIRAVLSFIKDSSTPLDGFRLNSLISIPVVIFLNFIIKNLLLLFCGIDVLGDILI